MFVVPTRTTLKWEKLCVKTLSVFIRFIDKIEEVAIFAVLQAHNICLIGLFYRSVYFTANSGYRSLKNRSCVTVFGYCSATLTVGEPLGDVSGSAKHNFRTSVTGISGEIDASLFYYWYFVTLL